MSHGNGTPSAPDALTIERSFDAPVEVVWRMWTDPEHFRAWYGPAGATIPVAELDVRVGGTRRVCMEVSTPGGPMRMWFTGEHREVVENERLVYTESTADHEGGATSPPTEVVVQLAAVGGGTRMLLTHVGIAPDSPGASGWAMALDKLATHVAATRAG